LPTLGAGGDRRGAIRGPGLPIRDAVVQEWEDGREAVRSGGIAGAAKFAGGLGRHGDFGKIE